MAGVERSRPALQRSWIGLHQHQIGSGLRIASWLWLFVAATIVVTRLDSLNPGPWESVELAALVVAPAICGVLLSLHIDRRIRRARES